VQYVDYATHAIRGDLGVGLRSQRPVLDSILEVLPSTVQLTAAALAIAATLGISMGIMAAVSHGSWFDTAIMSVAMLGISARSSIPACC
jgi:peptide/nickel transport system permease protein